MRRDVIYYREPVFRPPSEAYSLLIKANLRDKGDVRPEGFRAL